MPPKRLKRAASSTSLPSKASKLTLEPVVSVKKGKALKPVSKPPVFDIKGKGKETDVGGVNGTQKSNLSDVGIDDRLWVDIYEPVTEAELAVHKRKVEDVRRWFLEAFEGGPTGKLQKYRRILTLTGPAGTAKTTTVRVLAREIGFEILEWRNSVDDNFAGDDFDRQSLHQKFETFLGRASTCQPLMSSTPSLSSSASTSRSASSLHSSSSQPRRQIILLEDLPNILHPPTQAAFHDTLSSFVYSPSTTPLVIVVSDAGTRGEARDERIAQNGFGGSKDVVDVRTVVPTHLLGGPFVTQISFNPIAPTLLQRALQAMLTKHFTKASTSSTSPPPKEALDIIVESSNGDIRSAVMALQFAYMIDSHGPEKVQKRKKKSPANGTRVLLEAVTRREQSLALFHLMGKVLYNKRKRDPPQPSATAKEIRITEQLDAKINDPPPLPPWLLHHDRRGSRVDVDTLYADSPVDTSLFSLYIHQNYTQFCNELDQCSDISDWLSWIDSSGGEHWHQANPHQFHLLTLGTLHALPSPVPRRSQKMYKPEFFDILKKSRNGEDGIGDVRTWLQDLSVDTEAGEWHGMRVGAWSRAEVVTELGAILRLSRSMGDKAPPPSHRAFSAMPFKVDSLGMQQLGDDDDGYEEDPEPSYGQSTGGPGPHTEDMGGGWLETDDIEDF